MPDMMGNSQQDLERIKTNIKRLKFGTIELSTERAFLRSILESRPLPQQPPAESDAFKHRNAQLKALKDANDADEKVVEALVDAVGESAAGLATEHAALGVQVGLALVLITLLLCVKTRFDQLIWQLVWST